MRTKKKKYVDYRFTYYNYKDVIRLIKKLNKQTIILDRINQTIKPLDKVALEAELNNLLWT